MHDLIPSERIESRIYLIRGQKVMLDRDLAELYGVPTKALKQAVRRNRRRFPGDFVFSLSKQEILNWLHFVTGSSRSQSVTLKRGHNIKYPPFAFTENGVAMLSSVLHCERAIEVNVQIMRAFTKLREVLATHKEVSRKLKELEQRVEGHDSEIKAIFDAIRKLMEPEGKNIKRIGFVTEE